MITHLLKCYLSTLLQKGLSEHKNNKDSDLQKICQTVIVLITDRLQSDRDNHHGLFTECKQVSQKTMQLTEI